MTASVPKPSMWPLTSPEPQRTLSCQPPTPDGIWVLTPIPSQPSVNTETRASHSCSSHPNSPSLYTNPDPQSQEDAEFLSLLLHREHSVALERPCRIRATQDSTQPKPLPAPGRFPMKPFNNCRKRHAPVCPSTLTSIPAMLPQDETHSWTSPDTGTCPFPKNTSEGFRTPLRTGVTPLPPHTLPAELPAPLREPLLPFSGSHFLLTSGRVGSAEILRPSLQTRKRLRSPEKG